MLYFLFIIKLSWDCFMKQAIFLLLFFFIGSWAQVSLVDSISIAEKRFKDQEAFHAVVLLDRYLRSHENLNLELWRIWGELQIDDLESAQWHYSRVDSLFQKKDFSENGEDSSCIETRFKLISLYKDYIRSLKEELTEVQKEALLSLMRERYTEVRHSKCIFDEDRLLYQFLTSVIRPSWNQVFSGLLSYGIGYSQNPIHDENQYEESDSKAFHSWVAGIEVNPWMENFPVQPHFDLRWSGWYYFPKAPNNFHRSVVRTRLGGAWQRPSFNMQLHLVGSLLFQEDSLYSGYPIYQEYKALELDFSLKNGVGLRARLGNRLYREEEFSRSELEAAIYAKRFWNSRFFTSVSYSLGMFSASNPWNDFLNESILMALLWQVHPRVEFWNYWNLEYRYYDYPKVSVPREDWIWQWQPTLSFRLASSLQLNLSYSYFYKKIKQYKETIDYVGEDVLTHDHTLSLQLEWKPSFDYKRISSQRSPDSYRAPWASGVALSPELELQMKAEKAEGQMNHRESEPQGGHRCRE